MTHTHAYKWEKIQDFPKAQQNGDCFAAVLSSLGSSPCKHLSCQLQDRNNKKTNAFSVIKTLGFWVVP